MKNIAKTKTAAQELETLEVRAQKVDEMITLVKDYMKRHKATDVVHSITFRHHNDSGWTTTSPALIEELVSEYIAAHPAFFDELGAAMQRMLRAKKKEVKKIMLSTLGFTDEDDEDNEEA